MIDVDAGRTLSASNIRRRVVKRKARIEAKRREAREEKVRECECEYECECGYECKYKNDSMTFILFPGHAPSVNASAVCAGKSVLKTYIGVGRCVARWSMWSCGSTVDSTVEQLENACGVASFARPCGTSAHSSRKFSLTAANGHRIFRPFTIASFSFSFACILSQRHYHRNKSDAASF